MKRKATDDNFDEERDSTKVRRLLLHRSGTVETPGWREQFYPQVSSDADIDLRKVIDNFVTLYERLDTADDINVKPNYSYTELVFLAVLRSPNFCLPITEIYRYIQHRFTFFRHSTREHWKNAVRHSLSKTKCFTKINVGRGVGKAVSLNRSTFLWSIVPSSVVSFARGDYRSTVDKESGTNTLRWGYYKVNAGDFWDRVSLVLQQKQETFKRMMAFDQSPGKTFAMQKCEMPRNVKCSNDVGLTTTKTADVSPFANANNITTQLPNISNSSISPSNMQQPSSTQNVFNFAPPPPNCSPFTGIQNPYSLGTYVNYSLNDSRDSGNETMLEGSPEERPARNVQSSPNLNSSYLSKPEMGTREYSHNESASFLELSPFDKKSIEHQTSAILRTDVLLNPFSHSQCSPKLSSQPYPRNECTSVYTPYYQTYETQVYPFSLATTTDFNKPFCSPDSFVSPSPGSASPWWLNQL